MTLSPGHHLGQRRAAAVCYRQGAAGPELLLVTTSNSSGNYIRWTFPKGHVESGESGAQAAAREAREEAGVEGRIGREILASYREQWGDGEIAVDAYLMEVDREVRPDEKRRREWVSVDAAISRLAISRPREFIDEHRRVLAAAAKLIARRASASPP